KVSEELPTLIVSVPRPVLITTGTLAAVLATVTRALQEPKFTITFVTRPGSYCVVWPLTVIITPPKEVVPKVITLDIPEHTGAFTVGGRRTVTGFEVTLSCKGGTARLPPVRTRPRLTLNWA